MGLAVLKPPLSPAEAEDEERLVMGKSILLLPLVDLIMAWRDEFIRAFLYIRRTRLNL